ncbi:MAG: hypothetical protein GY934_09775 [Gammaproteobacteria bacterium]|nr:hypothetical protein [Gammaproteobacteria bacterium]
MEITNQERFWYIIFTLWCQRHGKDHTTEDFNQIKDDKIIGEVEYESLRGAALFQILKAGRCPTCWEMHGQKLRAIKGKPGHWSLVCHCKVGYDVNADNKTGEVNE